MISSMKRDEICSKAQELFREVFDESDLVIHDEMTAADVDEWDSLNHIKLIMTVEQEFGVKFSTVEVVALNNVGDFINLIDQHVNRQ